MDADDYDRLRWRLRGPLYEAQEYFDLMKEELTICSESKAILKQVQEDLERATQSTNQLIAYIERMYGFNQ